MSAKVKITKYPGKEWTDDRWFSYNQAIGGRAIPGLPGTDNLQSLHILDSAEEKSI